MTPFVQAGVRRLRGIGLILCLVGVSPAFRTSGADDSELQTGQGIVLQRVVRSLSSPTNAPSASLRFHFAFGTDESLIPGEFLDSFSVTVRTTNRAHSVTLLTVDRFGVTWAPGATPAGVLDPDQALRYGPSPMFPTALTNFAFTVAHSVLVQLPAPFLNQPSQLVLTLFDNDDAEASGAVLGGVSVHRGDPARIAVESSASPAGPYAREDGVRIDPLGQTITVARRGSRRFYRLEGDTPSRAARLQPTPAALVIDYEKEIGQPRLFVEGAGAPHGPFAPVNNATVDLSANRAIVPLLQAPAFLRVAGSHPVRVINDIVSGNQRILEFQIFAVPPRLESSTEPAGPFAAEMGVAADPFVRRLRLPGGGVARFYRLSSDVPLLLRETVLHGDLILLHYETP